MIPIYVTRKTGNGLIGSLSVKPYVAVVFMLLLQLNVLVWSIVGLITAGKILL